MYRTRAIKENMNLTKRDCNQRPSVKIKFLDISPSGKQEILKEKLIKSEEELAAFQKVANGVVIGLVAGMLPGIMLVSTPYNQVEKAALTAAGGIAGSWLGFKIGQYNKKTAVSWAKENVKNELIRNELGVQPRIAIPYNAY